jgi:hypothetical protein
VIPEDVGEGRQRTALDLGLNRPEFGPHEGLGAVGEHCLHIHHDGALGAFALEGQACQSLGVPH